MADFSRVTSKGKEHADAERTPSVNEYCKPIVIWRISSSNNNSKRRRRKGLQV